MQARSQEDWLDEDDCRGRPERVVAVDDGFVRGATGDGLCIQVRSQEFRQGRVNAVFAGVTIDLREAKLGPEGATLDVQSALSGIDILVPPGWSVICDIDAVFGGIADHRLVARSAEPRPRLRLTGTLVAGGLSVR
jgi:hypothetical protein